MTSRTNTRKASELTTEEQQNSEIVETLLKRYQGASTKGLVAVLCPLLVPVAEIDRTANKLQGQSHWRGTFKVAITEENRSVIVVGRTGKFVPKGFADGGTWREIAKGRIIEVDSQAGMAVGEIYTGQAGSKEVLESALAELSDDDYLEIDQYGAAAKVLSGLAEHELAKKAQAEGFTVYRMPEDMAKHLGCYANYDFEFEKDGIRKRVEVKSLWGTNTEYARLIHSTTTKPKGEENSWTEEQRKNYYPTSSCKFATQDIFAVNLFLRTGKIGDFAFARSVSSDEKPHGLPSASGYPEHVNQNPTCTVGDGKWYGTISEVWNLD